MIKKILLPALIIFAVTSTALAAGHDVKIVNETGKTITKIFLSTIALDDWQNVSCEILRDEESVDICVDPAKFNPNPIVRYFDIRAEYDDGSEEIWLGLDLFNIAEVALRRGEHSVTYEN